MITLHEITIRLSGKTVFCFLYMISLTIKINVVSLQKNYDFCSILVKYWTYRKYIVYLSEV